MCICPVLSEETSLTESVLFTDLQLYCVSGTGNSGKSIHKDALCYHENFNSSAAKEAIISVLANSWTNSLDLTPELHKGCKEHCCNHYWNNDFNSGWNDYLNCGCNRALLIDKACIPVSHCFRDVDDLALICNMYVQRIRHTINIFL